MNSFPQILDTPKDVVWHVLVAVVLLKFTHAILDLNTSHVYTGSRNDNLDDLFSTSPLPVDNSLGSSSDFLEGFGQSHDPHVSAAEADPFDIFHSPPKEEPRPMQNDSEDLLGGFEGSLGEESEQKACSALLAATHKQQYKTTIDRWVKSCCTLSSADGDALGM